MIERKVGFDRATNRGNAGKGRRKGVPNKITAGVREMILGALDDAGGQNYLVQQAHQNPAAFMTLLGKVLPKEFTGAAGTELFRVFDTTKLSGMSEDELLQLRELIAKAEPEIDPRANSVSM